MQTPLDVGLGRVGLILDETQAVSDGYGACLASLSVR